MEESGNVRVLNKGRLHRQVIKLKAEKTGTPKGTILELFFRNLCQSGHRRGYQLADLKCGFDPLAPLLEHQGLVSELPVTRLKLGSSILKRGSADLRGLYGKQSSALSSYILVSFAAVRLFRGID